MTLTAATDPASTLAPAARPAAGSGERLLPASLFGFINRFSWRDQLVITAITLISFPFLYYSLDLPKIIINQAIRGDNFPKQFFGTDFEQIEYLLLLSFMFLGLVLINGGFKLWINIYKGRTGERMLRRLRYTLYARLARFPAMLFTRTSPGEVVPMITAECETLGGFIGDSYSLPLFAGGQLFVILSFMVIQDPLLGLAAVALYPLQIWLIPKLQARVNRLTKERIRLMRSLSDRITETATNLGEIQSNAAGRRQLADFSARMEINYRNRFRIFQWKFFIKFLNNLIAQLTPFSFFLIGGYLVIKGDLTFGALVAALSAYKDLGPLWRELLDYYQSRADAVLKYEQIVQQFAPPGMIPEARDGIDEADARKGSAEIALGGVSLTDDTGLRLLAAVSATVAPGEHVAVIGPDAGTRSAVARIAAGLIEPSAGTVRLDGRAYDDLPRDTVARRIGYVPAQVTLFAGSVRENLVTGLQARPGPPVLGGLDIEEARRTGNTTDDIRTDWIDYAAAGAADARAFEDRLQAVLERVDLIDDMRELGLRGSIDPDTHPILTGVVLEVRPALIRRLSDPAYRGIYAPFDRERFNDHASLAENMLFGTPVGTRFDLDELAAHAGIARHLRALGVWDRFLGLAIEVARTLGEIFKGLPPGHPIMERYSFVSADELSDHQAAIEQADRQGRDHLDQEAQVALVSMLLRLVPARHRLDEVDDQLRAQVLAARAGLPDALSAEDLEAISFFAVDRYNQAASIRDNLLFGRLAPGQDGPGGRIRRAVMEELTAIGKLEQVLSTLVEAGLTFQVGVGGARLTPAIRQKIAIARALLRAPDIFVLDDPLATLDTSAQSRLIAAVLEEAGARGAIWCLQRPSLARLFARTVVIEDGHVVDDGPTADVEQRSTTFRNLAAAE